MFPREYRPLKRPKLGVPDYYPQEDKQKEDELTFQTLYYGYRCTLTVDPQDEVGSALKEFSQQATLLNKEQYISHLNKIVESKKRVGLVQDSQKKRAQVPKENFFPVPRRKEAAVSWFQDLASTKSLSQLSKKVPVFNKKEEIFDNLFEKDVPIFRAVWYIKMTAAYNASMTTETKLTKKKQQTDPSFEWTLSLTRYMQECVWRIVNKGAPPNWSEGGGTGSRHSSQSSVTQATPTGDQAENTETSKWHYMVQLSSCLYEENLLDRHEFLRWLVERIEEVKPSDTAQLQLYIPLVLKHLRDLGHCVSLARPLVTYLCHRLRELYEIDDNMQKLAKAGGVVGGVAIKEEDDVFVEPSKGKMEAEGKAKSKEGQGTEGPRVGGGGGGEGSGLERPTSIPLLKERKASGDVEGVGHTQNEDDERPPHFYWCPHHTSLMLQLSCVVQTIAIFCPTAFVMIKSTLKVPGKDQAKPVSPLSLLPVSITDLPMPKTLDSELQKKILTSLGAAETEIVQRNKTVEACWSSVAVSDLQTTSEGANIQRVLAVLDVLDSHSFSTCRAHNPISTLYVRIVAVQKSFECPLCDDRFVMLLCQWAVTPHRSGDHRPLVAARILCQRQIDILQGGGEWKERSLDALDESWEDCCGSWSQEASDFPFQNMLLKFLDARAPLPDDLAAPLKATDPFFHLVSFFAELIHLGVFSYNLYLCTLIARGDAKSPVVPLLPFACDPQHHHQRELDLGGLPLRKKPRMDSLDTPMSSLPVTLSPSGSFIVSGQSGFTFDDLVKGPTLGSHQGMGAGVGGVNESGNMEGNVAMIQERQNKLERLLQQHSSGLGDPVQLTFPFPPSETSTSPLLHGKSDPFNFASPNSTLFLDDDQQPPPMQPHPLDMPLNKEGARHLLYATYFPTGNAHLSRQELNKRAVVLYGVGRSRGRVEKVIKKVSYDVEQYFRQLSGVQTPVLPQESTCRLEELVRQFRTLPTFEQSVLALSCEVMLRASLQAPPSSQDGGVVGVAAGMDHALLFPACAQLVLVCELLETAGCVGRMLDLVVDVIACDAMTSEGEEEGVELPSQVNASSPVLPSLPRELCLPVACLLHRYLLCLLLSQNNTTIVFERLCKVLDGVRNVTEINAGQRAIFIFLNCLYSSCSYLQNTYRAMFDPLCARFGDLLVENYSPIASEHLWQRTPVLLYGLTKCSDTSTVPSICNWIKANQPGSVSIFVIDVFSQACQVNISSQALYDLAQVCAGVTAVCGKQVNSELLGAFRALCLPTNIFKFCQSGYSQLTSRNNILMNAGIHSSLITFVALLMATGCLLLNDIISYIIKPIISVQLTNPLVGSSQHRILLLQFMNSLVLHLLVDDYIRGEGCGDDTTESHILLPPFVRHFLQAKCRDLDFSYIVSLVKDLFRISQSASRGAAISSVKMGMQVLVQSSSDGMEGVLERAKMVLESLATQSWVREKCMQHKVHIMDKDKLGDTSLTPAQAQYLLNLLSPYRASKASFPAGNTSLPYGTDSSAVVEDILKNLDQWTLRNALLQINVQISQASSANVRTALMDNLAGQVIRVFEDSCGDEWLGQTIESCIEGGDGAYSPHVWLVTPLISQLPPLVLGRVLKGAGVVLGQGQWWNPEKSQEKRRSTRATSGVVQTKTGLQWQQPFLELVLACMRVQSTTHEELLGPLKSQLSNFSAMFEKEGMPTDEQSKTILYAALKLRLSLVGSMLVSISTNETSTLDWVPLLMQLLCSGAVDRQPDCTELFTNAVDMLSTLLATLPCDFYICFSSGGEDGKKTYTSCVKRLKSELSSIKSVYGNEIRQLFPLTPKPCEVITVRTAIAQPKGSPQSERVRGLRVQDTKEVSSWDVLEGVKNTGPLMLSWFGAVRMKRRMLKYEEQWKMVRLHTHQKDKPYKSHFVSLPEINPMSSADSTQEAEAAPQPQEDETKMETDAGKQAPAVSGAQDVGAASKMKQVTSVLGGITPLPPSMPNSATAVMPRLPTRPVMMRGGLPGPYSTGMAPNRAQLVRTLQNVRAMNQPQQQNQIFIQQPGLTVQRSQIFTPSEMDLYRQQQQQQLLRQQRMLQMRQQQQQQQQQQQYQFRSQMRMVAPQSATPVQLQQQLMGQQGGFPAALGQGQQQQPPPPHQQGMMMRQQPAGQFTGPQQTAPGFMPGRMF